jgi:PAS domain S-box-containing protein
MALRFSASNRSGEPASGPGPTLLDRIGRLHRSRWVGRPRSGRAYAVAFLCVAAATLVRAGVELFAAESEVFAAYFPAVFVATLVGGLGPGIFALLLGGFAGWFLFVGDPYSFAFPRPDEEIASLALYVVAASAGLLAAVLLRRVLEAFEDSEAQRRDIDARLRRAQAGGGMGEWEVNLSDGTAVWSTSMFDLLGLDPSQSAASPQLYYERIHRGDIERVFKQFTDAAESGAPFESEFRIVRPDGTQRWLLGRAQREIDHEGKAILAGVNFDITERKAIEEQLARSERRFRTLITATTSIVWSTTKDGGIIEPNPVFEAYTGLKWPDYADQGWRQSLNPDDLPELEAIWLAASQKQRAFEAKGRLWHQPSRSYRYFVLHSVPLLDRRGRTEEWIGTLTDVHDLHMAGEQQRLLMGELRHRMKNMLMVIQALANRGRRNPQTAAFVETFTARLKALSGAYDLLLRADWSEAIVGDLLGQTLAPFHGCQFTHEGPRVAVRSNTAVSIAMAVHELATNAIKHGAWSTPAGRVKIAWQLRERDGESQFELEWNEQGGPKVVKPESQGFGTMLIVNALAAERDGQVTLDYEPDGLRCRMSFALGSMAKKKAS